jgi:hypothetical protein
VVVLVRINWIGEVPVTERRPGGEGDVVGVAKVEKLRSGALVHHINLSGMSLEKLRRGFSLGELPKVEEPCDESES